MIYVLVLSQIKSDKVGEYEDMQKGEGVSFQQKHGIKVIGVWKNWLGGDTFEFVRIHAFEDLADFERKESSLHSDPEFQRYLRRMALLHVGRTRRLMRPTEYSPLQ